jgi:hypothetical protein
MYFSKMQNKMPISNPIENIDKNGAKKRFRQIFEAETYFDDIN